LNDIPAEEDNKVSIVDDMGLALYSLGGAPGSDLKHFISCMSPAHLNSLLDKTGDKRCHVELSMGATFFFDDQIQRIVLTARFPALYQKQNNYNGWGIDEYIEHKTRVDPRAVLMEWLWHRFRRRLKRVI